MYGDHHSTLATHVSLDQKVNVTLVLWSTDWGVWSDNLLAVLVLETFLTGATEDYG